MTSADMPGISWRLHSLDTCRTQCLQVHSRRCLLFGTSRHVGALCAPSRKEQATATRGAHDICRHAWHLLALARPRHESHASLACAFTLAVTVHTPLAGLSLQPLLCCQRRNRLLWASLRRCQPGQWARRTGEVLFVSRVPVPRVWLKPRWRVSGLWFALSAEAGASRPPPHCESPVLTPFAMSWASTAPRHTPYVSYHIQCLAAGPQLNRLWLADLSLQPCCQRRNRLPWASLRHCWLGQLARPAGKVHLGFRVPKGFG